MRHSTKRLWLLLVIDQLLRIPVRIVRSQILFGNPLHQFPCLRIVKTVMTWPADCQDILFDSKSALRARHKMCLPASRSVAEDTKAVIPALHLLPYFRWYRTHLTSFALVITHAAASSLTRLLVVFRSPAAGTLQ